jgi:hypothetical protein
VPVLLFLIPDRAQTALATLPAKPPSVDPLALGAALETTAAKHHVRFFDATPAFAASPDFQSLFYMTDGHPRPAGHAALAGVMAQALLSDPVFARCAHPG